MVRKKRDVLTVELDQAELADLGKHHAQLTRAIAEKDKARKQENKLRNEEIKRLRLEAEKLEDQIISGERDQTIFDSDTDSR